VVEVPVGINSGLLWPETTTAVVSEEHELLGPLYSSTVYGEVPPDQVTVAVTVADCPESMAGGEMTSVVATSAGLTVTAAAEVVDTLSPETAPSVTVAQ
jgi:hypothetical protein